MGVKEWVMTQLIFASAVVFLLHSHKTSLICVRFIYLLWGAARHFEKCLSLKQLAIRCDEKLQTSQKAFLLTFLISTGRSAKLTVIGFVCNFSNISEIKRAQPMVEMMKAIIQKILSIQGREVSPMYYTETGLIERNRALGLSACFYGIVWMMIDVFIKI